MYVYRYNWDAASMKLDINTLTPDEDEAGYHGEFNQACYSEEDMQELVDEAREKGLHVIGWDK